MRTNLPVTQNEILLKDGQLIVSKTDTKGRITYVNQDFLEISGFTEKELIGEPHNLVRHPDMPVEAFADFWNSLKQGRPWTGYVKNRCKNGDYYWVKANASPIFESGQVTGYMSVREKPSREAVAAAEAVYARLRAGNSGLVVVEGQALPNNGLRLALRRVTVAQRVMVSLLVLLLAMLAEGLFGLDNLRVMEVKIKTLYEEHVAEVVELREVGDLYAVNIVDAAHKARNGNIPLDKALQTVSESSGKIRTIWKKFEGGDHPPEERKIVDQIGTAMKTADVAVAELVQILQTRNAPALAQFTIDRLYPAIDPVSDHLGAMITKILEGAKAEYDSSQTAYAESVREMLIALGVAAALAFVLGVWLVRSVRRPITEAETYFRHFAAGRLDVDIVVRQRDEMASILDAAKAMQVKLGFEMAETKRQADAMTRIKIALDNVSTGVMIADASRHIIYANNSVQHILKEAESEIRTQLPNFSADHLVGQNIDAFHKDPSHQAGLLARLTASHTANLRIGARHLVVTASPVINDRNERLGAVAEWRDRTAEVTIENEVADIVSAATRGDLTQRLAMDGKTGFFASLTEGLNHLLDNTQQALIATSEVLGRVARGDLTQTIQADFAGIFGQLKDDTNTTIERLREVVGRIKDASEAINTASREIAAGNTDLSSRTEQQASSLEETSSSMEELNATVRQNAESATQANALASSSNEIATRGGQIVRQAGETMQGIQESSLKIADIIRVIDSIAFQTNILALNAAVEAARAGEQGRGFAVVASEVRNLAQRSAEAAKEIKELIAESVAKVDQGVQMVGQAGSTMEEVVTSFSQVAALVTDISNASREQSSGIEQVTQAVTQMDEVTQQNAALVEEAAAAAESLEEQARGLVQAVSLFKLEEGSGSRRDALVTLQVEPTRRAVSRTVMSSGAKKIAKPAPTLVDDEGDKWEEF
jgi:methyl-accepting chemotaxis protein